MKANFDTLINRLEGENIFLGGGERARVFNEWSKLSTKERRWVLELDSMALRGWAHYSSGG